MTEMPGTRRAVITRLSDVEPDREGARIAHAVREAALKILPGAWRVLPDGRATHSVLAKVAGEILDGDQ